MTQPNQFTKARDEGREVPAGTNHYKKGLRKHMDPRQKAQIRATQLMERMHKFILGKPFHGKKIVMDNNQVTAARVLIDKGMPSLQAIEQSSTDPLEAMSEGEMTELIRAHIKAHPEVLQALNLAPAPAIVPSDASSDADMPLATGTDGPLQP